MKIPDRHFLKFAGVEPARQMRKEQRLAQSAAVNPVPYEKPPDSPDRPSNMDRKRLEAVASGLPEADNPTKIAEASWTFKPPIPEGQEEGVVRDSPDNPSAILRANGEARPPAEPQGQPPDLDNPSAITKALSEFKPPPENTGVSSPAGANLQTQALPPSLEADAPGAILASMGQQRPKEMTAQEATVSDLPAESRPLPEAATGLIVRERA